MPSKRLSSLLVIACVLLALSVLSNLGLARAALVLFRELNQARLDPLGLRTYAAEPKPPASARRLVMFGDSRALMWTPPEVAHGFQLVQRGIGQQTSGQILARFDQDLATLHPQVVLLQLGVNDLKAIPVLPHKEAEIIANTSRNITRLVERCRELGAEVILVTIFPHGDVPWWRTPVWSDRVAYGIKQVNTQLTKLANEHVHLLNADEVLLDQQGRLHPGFALDLLHLTDTAYAKLNQHQLSPLLSRLAR